MERHLLTRRGLLGTSAAAAAGAAALRAPTPAQATETSCAGLAPAVAKVPAGGRIDLHTHHIPPVYRAALTRAGMLTIAGYPTPVWTPERHLLMMEEFGIQMAVLSLSDPSVTFRDGTAARTLARQVNEYTADLVRKHPTRFGGFVNLPLPDVEGALEELAHGLDVLKLDGVSILSSYNGVSVTDARFEPLWAEISRRGAYVFMHPAAPGPDDKPSLPLPDFIVEFTFETTRFAALMLKSGLVDRYPNLRVQLAHAGGMFPFVNHRVRLLQEGPRSPLPAKPGGSQTGVLPDRRTNPFFYDTAISPSTSQMRCLLETTDINHVVFSSDWPFTELLFLIPGDPQEQLKDTFDKQQRLAVDRANALRQLPTVAARLGHPAFDNTVDAELERARAVRTGTGRRQVRMLVALGEDVQIEASLTRDGRTLAAQRFAPVSRGARSLRLEVADGVGAGRASLTLRVTDAFSNVKVLRGQVTIPRSRLR